MMSIIPQRHTLNCMSNRDEAMMPTASYYSSIPQKTLTKPGELHAPTKHKKEAFPTSKTSFDAPTSQETAMEELGLVAGSRPNRGDTRFN